MTFELHEARRRIEGEEKILEAVDASMENQDGMRPENVRDLNWTRIETALSILSLRRTMEEEKAA